MVRHGVVVNKLFKGCLYLLSRQALKECVEAPSNSLGYLIVEPRSVTHPAVVPLEG